MRLFTILIATTLSTAAVAQDSRFVPGGPILLERGKVLPEVDPRGAEFDEACSKIAFQVIMGMQDPRGAGWIKTCGNHPNGNVCKETRGVIMQAGKSIDMTCSGRMAR